MKPFILKISFAAVCFLLLLQACSPCDKITADLYPKRLAGTWTSSASIWDKNCKRNHPIWHFTADGKCGMSTTSIQMIGRYDIDPCDNRMYIYFPHDTLVWQMIPSKCSFRHLYFTEKMDYGFTNESKLYVDGYNLSVYGHIEWDLDRYKYFKKGQKMETLLKQDSILSNKK
jgi:hypothetical protein